MKGYLGQLKVTNGKLTDTQGNLVVLRGMSSHGLSWYPDLINADSIRYMREKLGFNVVRLAMYTAELNGYCVGDEENKQILKDKIDEAIKAATDNEMYVIVDWHILEDGNPNKNKAEAIKFFDEVVGKYAEYDNILYEICNEPNGEDVKWIDVKNYAQEVIPVIRSHDENAIVLVGTPSWCQRIDEAMESPLDFDNIMYTFHFYAKTHRTTYREALRKALDAKFPVFVSEFGICAADGAGAIDEEQSASWMKLLNEYGVSACMWNLSNRDETSAFLKPECEKLTGWTDEDYRESGIWMKDNLTYRR